MSDQNVKSHVSAPPQSSMAEDLPTAPSPPPISVGRIVFYVPDSDTDVTAGNRAEVVPAIVVRAWSPSLANLQVFIDGEKGVTWKTSVEYSADRKPGTWHWPPRI